MILMLILVAVAAFYGLILPFRCATFALPVLAGLGLAFTLRNLGRLDGHSAGLLAGISADALGRHSARGPAPFAVRFAVILMFAGAAASAGYHAGLRSRCLPTSILGRSARLPSWLPSSPLMPVGAVSCRPGVGSSDRRYTACVQLPLILLLRCPADRQRIRPPGGAIPASRHAPSVIGPLR